ncbi:MAG: glutamate 5-kinase [Candidatus Saganbacteria bacterium]|nr:glutamate 5-kinase [Candidatus Saganbacteria bacterium]
MKTKTHKTIVIKLGSSSLTNEKRELNVANLQRIVKEILPWLKKKSFVIVSSGAIVSGSAKLGLKTKPKTIPEKQAAAAVGQTLLMKEYEKAFGKEDVTVAQVLLTRDAIADRERYLNARNTFLTLLKLGVIPIVNENDTVSIDEIKVGDNDTLAALVASLIGADLLINLTDIDGFYMDSEEGVSYLVDKIETITEEVENAARHPGTELGTGGMITKLQAAKIAQDAGVAMIIASGKKPGVITNILEGKQEGTFFVPKAAEVESRKRWLAHGLTTKGTISIDPGAASALKKGGSLLAVGVIGNKGSYQAGDLVSITNEIGREIGRGLINFTNHEMEKIMGKKSSVISSLLGYETTHEVIHRDNLVLIN